MRVECGFYDIETEPEVAWGRKYYVCRHRLNPRMLELVFVDEKVLSGKKELCKFIQKEILDKEER